MKTVRERIEIALRGGRPEKTPFTIYSNKLPTPAVLPELKRRGMGLVERIGVYRTRFPNCAITSTSYEENGVKLVRTDIRTPKGDLHTIRQPAGFTSWTHKYLFTDENDYPALAFYLDDAVVEPAYETALRRRQELDDNTILRGAFGLEPLQHLISGGVFGTMNFCLQWMENRDEVLRLYRIVREKRRQAYPIVAEAPVLHSNYGGNVVPEVIGLETFEQYYVPDYQEAAEAMHARGKLIGVHFDANCRLFKDAIAALDLDYIEAFTPAPDTDMTMREARKAWPGKVLWINFPSSVHLRSEEEIERETVALIEAAEPGDGFLIGITEDLPEGREDGNYRAILDGIDRYHAARRPLPLPEG
jgi:hypothetical protein